MKKLVILAITLAVTTQCKKEAAKVGNTITDGAKAIETGAKEIKEQGKQVKEAIKDVAGHDHAEHDHAGHDHTGHNHAEHAQTTFKEYKLSAANTTVGFIGSKLVSGSHEGKFESLKGLVKGSEVNDLKVSLAIAMNSVKTDSPKLDGHLKNQDFFEVEKYPSAQFESTKITQGENGKATVLGRLTMHGQTHPVSFPATISVDEKGIKVDSNFTIDRSKWGIVYGNVGDNLIKNDVVIKINLDTTKA